MEKDGLIESLSSQEEFMASYEALSRDERVQIMEAAEAKSLTISFLMGGKQDQYDELILRLQNECLLKMICFPVLSLKRII